MKVHCKVTKVKISQGAYDYKKLVIKFKYKTENQKFYRKRYIHPVREINIHWTEQEDFPQPFNKSCFEFLSDVENIKKECISAIMQDIINKKELKKDDDDLKEIELMIKDLKLDFNFEM